MASSWHARGRLGRFATAIAHKSDGRNIVMGEGFFPGTEPLFRTDCPPGTSFPDQRSLPLTGDTCDETSSRRRVRDTSPVTFFRFRDPRPEFGGGLSGRPR